MKRQTIMILFILIVSSSLVWASPDNELIETTKRGDIEGVRAALNNGANIETREQTDKVTAIMIAAFNGYDEIVKLLAQSGANVNAKSDKDGWVPLMHASFSNHASIVEFLLKSGANINAIDYDGDTVLMQTSFNGPIEIVKILLKHGADVTLKDTNGKTALDFAKLKGNKEIITLLEAYIEYNSDQNSSVEHDSKLIENIQKALTHLGYEVGGIDGKLGDKTIEAIKKFQMEHGLESTGKPSTALLSIISVYLPNTVGAIPEQKASPSTPKFSCRKKYCKNMTSCEEAYYLLKTCGYGELDRDNDGVPCENICPGG